MLPGLYILTTKMTPRTLLIAKLVQFFKFATPNIKTGWQNSQIILFSLQDG